MARARLSFNVLANAANFQAGKLLNLLARYRVGWLLVMNNLDFARQVKALDPGINVIYRSWPDDDAPTRYGYLERLKDLHQQTAGMDCWLYTNNESGFSDHVLDWSSNLMLANRNLGYHRKLVVGNFSSGTPNPDDWKRPAARRFIETINANRECVRLGLHEYMGAVWTSGFAGGIQPEQWPTSVEGISTWHVGRWRFLQQACRDMGIECPRIIITEHGMDDTSDIKAWLETLIKTPPFLNIRGWKSCVNQWAAWWPGWTAQRAYFEQIKQADKVLYAGSQVEAQLIFGWGDSGGWEAFDVQDADELHELLIAAQSVEPAAGVIPAGWYRSEDPKSWYIRSDAYESAATLGMVLSDDLILVLPEAPRQTAKNTWQRMRVYKAQPSALEIEGWVATGIKLKKQIEPPPPPPEPEPEPEFGLTKDDLLKLAALHQQIATIYAAAAAR